MKQQIKVLTKSSAGYGFSLLRIMIGIVFIAHGSQKLFGAFGGYGLEGTGQYMASLGLTPGYLMALLAGLGEFVGGSLILLGLLTRLGGIITAIVSIVALFTVHISHGFFIATSGMEYILVLLFASIAFIVEGSGKIAVDQYISKNK